MLVDIISRKNQKKCQNLRRCNSVKQNDDKYARKFYQGMYPLMICIHIIKPMLMRYSKKGGGSDVQLSAVGKMCVGTAKTNQMPHIITILLKI